MVTFHSGNDQWIREVGSCYSCGKFKFISYTGFETILLYFSSDCRVSWLCFFTPNFVSKFINHNCYHFIFFFPEMATLGIHGLELEYEIPYSWEKEY